MLISDQEVTVDADRGRVYRGRFKFSEMTPV